MRARGTGRWLGGSFSRRLRLRLLSLGLSLPSLSLLVSGGIWGAAGAGILARNFHWAFFYGIAGTALCALAGALAVVVLAAVLPARGPWLAAESGWHALPFWLPALDFLLPGSTAWRGPVLWTGALLIWIFIRVDGPAVPRRLWLALAVGLPLVVYLLDLSPYVGRADTFEFQVIGPQLGIAHPSGYPLYTLISKLFSLLPLGTVAWRINLSSAVFAALASGFLFLALDRAAAGSADAGPWGAAGGTSAMRLAAALTLAFSPTLWSRAVEAEVYALNACLCAAFLWLAIRWHTGAVAGARDADTPVGYLWPAFGLALGLALASHITLGALAFVAASGLLLPGRWPSWRAWLLAMGLGTLGLLLYAYIPLRWPAVTGGEFMSLGQFWEFVTNAGSGGALRPFAFYQDPARWSLVGRLFLLQVGWGGLAMAGLGLAALAWTLPALALGLVLAFLAWLWFGLSFYVAEPDYSAFFIPAHVLLVFLLGWGVTMLQTALARLGRRIEEWGDWRRGAGVLLAQALSQGLLVAVLVLPLSRLWITGPGLDTRSQGHSDEAWARYVLGLPLAEGAAVLADSEKFPPLYYLQQIEGLRPDVQLVTLFDEQQYRQSLEARLNAGQQVYLARYLPGMDGYGVSSLGPLVAVAPPSLTGDGNLRGVAFGDALVLREVELQADPVGRSMHHLTLVWTVQSPVQADLDVRLRLVRPDAEAAEVVWEAPARRPVGGYTTTEAWRPGSTVHDYHALVWPAWLPSGAYTLEVALFPHFETLGLPVAGSIGTWHALGEVVVVPPGEEHLPNRHTVLLASPRGSEARVSVIRLVGSRAPGEVAAGSPLDLDLAWMCRDEGGQEIRPIVWWIGPDNGVEVAQPLAGRGEVKPGFTCSGAGPLVRRYSLVAPTQPGRYRLELGALDAGGLDPVPARCDWLGRFQDRCPIATIDVGAAGAGLANLAGRVLLLDAETDAGGVPAGGPLYVTMRWRALEAMALDYTVFVQVIGPDGQVYGQADSWPGQGARPTSGWRSGEEVADPYSFYVRPEGPPGEYRIIVGLYLLADMSRLSVIDAAGNAISDFHEIGSFSLP